MMYILTFILIFMVENILGKRLHNGISCVIIKMQLGW